ncbi:MAG: cyclic nucleotide-binding domain-containing protein [Rhodospirillales bacterium]|nr:cyclic nucleotide-binding domain-containing protein [Rhodospirillales bacterium]
MTNDKDETFTRIKFSKGDFLLKEGESGDAAFVIVKGKVEIRVDQFGKNPQSLATRSSGDVIGELALFDDRPHMASAVALEDTVVNAMSRDEFRRRLEKMDPAMRGIMKLMVRRTREMADGLMKEEAQVNWADWRIKD